MMYDVIVVGAGSAGAVLAARLSEDGRRSVLLVEAGPDYPALDQTPPDLLDSRNLAGMAHDWNYSAVAVSGRNIPYRRGKVTGGTSAINAAAAQWARPTDMDSWANAGNADWTWEQTMPFFRVVEDDGFGPSGAHGRDGPITISRYGESDLIPLQRAFREACLTCGFPDVDDHNSPLGSGIGPWPMNRQGVRRISTALAYLTAARPRRNLTIREGVLVDRLALEGGRAVAIRLDGGEVIEGRHIALCAGAIGTPAILLRSGIGPARALEALDIPVVLDAPGVGAKLWDHAAVPIYLRPGTNQCVPGRDPRFQMMARFSAEGSSQVDDMQLVMTTHMDISASTNLLAAAGVPVVAVLRVALMLPQSHGSLDLVSPDPKVQPLINLNYLADNWDMRRLMNGTRLAWKVACSEALHRETRGVVGLGQQTLDSDELLCQYLRSNTGTYCHAMGTAPMGSADDPGAVANQHGQVRGIEGLWIADASLFPLPVRAVPNLTVMVLAERVASWLSQAATLARA